jgi:hypothetical protein
MMAGVLSAPVAVVELNLASDMFSELSWQYVSVHIADYWLGRHYIRVEFTTLDQQCPRPTKVPGVHVVC